MPGPVFGIAKSQVVNTDVIQLIASSARAFSAAMRARRQEDQRRQEFQSQKQEAETNIRLKEENLKLQQERLEFEKDREAKIEEERKSKQESRAARTERGQQAEKDRRTSLRIQAFRALDTSRQAAVNNSVRAIDKELARTRPLVQDPVLDADLLEFEGKSIQEIASEVRRRRASFQSIAGDELKALENPAMVQVRQQELDAAERALERRQGDFQIFAESQGHRFAPDNTVRSNLTNGLMNLIAGDLGVESQGEVEPAPKDQLQRASSKGAAAPARSQQTEGDVDAEPESTQLQGDDIVQRFVQASEADDSASINALRQESDKLSDEAWLARYRELEAAVGTERASALMLGTK